MVVLHITPVCLEVMPDSAPALEKAVRNVLSALAILHQEGFVHCDVRWPNVLKDSSNSWILSDFENAKPIGAIRRGAQDDFLPPESRGGQRYETAGDIWQVGRLIATCKIFNQMLQKSLRDASWQTIPNCDRQLQVSLASKPG